MKTNELILLLPKDCETAIKLITNCLQAKGLLVMRTFDLQSACAFLPDNHCPHHEDQPCDCQLVMLMVYGIGGQIASLIVHSHMRLTEFHLVDSPGLRAHPDLIDRIQRALHGYAPFKEINQSWEAADVP